MHTALPPDSLIRLVGPLCPGFSGHLTSMSCCWAVVLSLSCLSTTFPTLALQSFLHEHRNPPAFLFLSPRGWLRQHFRSVQTCFALRTGGAPGALCSCCIQVLGSGASSARLVILILAAARLSFRAIFPGPRADKAIKLAQELLGGLACSSSQAQEPADQYE